MDRKKIRYLPVGFGHGLLVLYHILFRGASNQQLLVEISQGYKGKVVVGKDPDIY